MSSQVQQTVRRIAAPDIRARKGGEPIVCLTAYTTPMAQLVDAHCDVALVGDSVGMVLHGLPSTLGVTMEMMVLHGKAVARGSSRACIVVDMPFGSYEEGPAQAFRNADSARVTSTQTSAMSTTAMPQISGSSGCAAVPEHRVDGISRRLPRRVNGSALWATHGSRHLIL